MKKLLITLCLLAVNACSNNDDKPVNPVDTLPPITQTGEDTFACLINRKPFFSSYKRRATYSGNSISISGSRQDDMGLRSVSIQGFNLEIIEEGLYVLELEKSGSFFGIYLVDGGLTLDIGTSDNLPGTLAITRFDLDEFIVSGTFEFTVVDDEGNKYEITDGRFDLKF
jgi:hypothetical protein